MESEKIPVEEIKEEKKEKEAIEPPVEALIEEKPLVIVSKFVVDCDRL